MNITLQYLDYLSFNRCNFQFNHIHTSSLKIIIYLFLFYHIPPKPFTVNMKAPKYRLFNKEKNKEETSNKIYFVSRGD